MANRRDNKGRVLNKGEHQRANGMYEYKYKALEMVQVKVYTAGS